MIYRQCEIEDPPGIRLNHLGIISREVTAEVTEEMSSAWKGKEEEGPGHRPEEHP